MSNFYEAYQKQVEKAAKKNSIYNPLGEVRKTINSLLEKSNTSSQTPTITGSPESAIKKNVQNGLSKMNGEDYSHLFDGIDDESIKKGAEMAKSAIENNKRKKAYIDTPLEKMPYMQDAMSMYYASIMGNNRQAAKLARALAYSVQEQEEASLSQTSSRTAEAPQSDSRYVNDEKGVRFRGSPGLSGDIFGTLSAGTEVKYTGNKIYDVDGYNWAEVEYDGKRGYIADKYLATSNQYEKDEPVSDPREKVEKKDLTPLREKTEEKGVSYLGLPQMKNKTFYEFLQEQLKQKDEKPEENKEPSSTASATEKPKEENKEEKPDSKRYVGTDTMKVYRRASWQSPVELTLSRGDEVEFTGRKETVGNTTWAQVKVGDKTGWVFANYLKTDKEQTVPVKSLPPYKQPRKKGEPLPVVHQTQRDVSDFACVLACEAMIFNYYGANVSVAELRKVNEGDVAKHDLLTEYAGLKDVISISYTVEKTPAKDVFEKCIEELRAGRPIMIEIKYDSGSSHSILVYGMVGDGTKASDFLAMDPYRYDKNDPVTKETSTIQDSINMLETRHINVGINGYRLVIEK